MNKIRIHKIQKTGACCSVRSPEVKIRSAKRKHFINRISTSGRSTQGQVMLLTTLILSGTILAAATLAGLLMVYQIRQSGDATQSAKAIFAADAGIEYELFKIYRYLDSNYGGDEVCNEEAPEFQSGVGIDTDAFREDNADGGQDLKITSTGISNDRARAFSLNLGETTVSTCFDS